MSGEDREQSWMGPLPATAGCDCHICRPEPSYDATDRRAIDTVLQHGWQVIAVAEDAGCNHDEDHHAAAHEHLEPVPTFAYTVGLGHRTGHPELLMSGLDRNLMHRVLNGLAQRVMAGLRIEPGDSLEDALAGVPIAAERVADSALGDTVTWSGWFHRRKPDALAIVWPDRSGVFAWQPGGPPILDDLQPRAWRDPIQHRGGLAPDPEWTFPVAPDRAAFSCTHVVDEGQAILWVARESDPSRGEDWTAHCGSDRHATDEMRVVHLAHLVRAAPSLRKLSDLGLDVEAFRSHPDAAWSRTPTS